jgi:hypothetical protein
VRQGVLGCNRGVAGVAADGVCVGATGDAMGWCDGDNCWQLCGIVTVEVLQLLLLLLWLCCSLCRISAT